MIFYDSKNEFYKEPFGAVAERTKVRFRFCAPRNLAAKEALLIIDQDGALEQSLKAQKYLTIGDVDVFECEYQPEAPGIYFYRFCVISSWDEWFFLVPGDEGGRLSNTKEGQYQLSVYAADYKVPHWIKGGLMYQIFPERFNRSKNYDVNKVIAKDPRAKLAMDKEYILREDWGGTPVYKPNELGIITNNDFFGGNLQGIIERLPYLENLGVTVIFLNPICEAFSSHRYDTADYKRVDPMLGTEEDFVELCSKAKSRGIKIILDISFNHTGSDSIYFNKRGRYPELGAYQSKKSPYYSWYEFHDHPDGYGSWWGINTLPQVHEGHPDFIDFIITGKNSVVKHWLSKGASGLRLDVADELPPVFLDTLRETVKSIDPDIVILGEVWEDASNKIAYDRRTQYFWGKQLDSVMHYPLKDATIEFLTNQIDGELFCAKLETLRENYPREVFYGTMNLLGTHDTARILTVLSLGGRLFQFPRDDKAIMDTLITNEELENGIEKLFLALLIWAFMPGIPCLYYGDELGMQGAEDPFNRKCFEEQKANQKVKTFYQDMLSFRKSLGEFGDWEYKPFICEENIFGFIREKTVTQGPKDKKTSILVVINRGEHPAEIHVPVGKEQAFGRMFMIGNVTKDEFIIKLEGKTGVIIEIM